MSEPLRNTYDWQQPVVMTALPAVFLALYALVTGRLQAWWMVLTVALVWAMYAGYCWLKTRAYAMLDEDDVLHVRRFFGMHHVRGEDVTRVKEIPNGRSPDILLLTRDGRRVPVPSSRLQGGHSVLFAWLLQHNPDVPMDKGATRVANALEERGLL